MKIALYSPGWPPEKMQNGIVTYVGMMRDALRAAGHEVVIITGKMLANDTEGVFASEPDTSGGLARKLLQSARRKIAGGGEATAQFRTNIAAALDRASNRSEFDVFEMEETYGHAMHVHDATGVPTVMRLHGPHFLGKFGAMAQRDQIRIEMEGDALRRTGVITSPSPGVLRDTLAYYGDVPAHSEVIANPVRIPAASDFWRRKEADPNLVAWVGRFDLRKGADTILSAFARVAAANNSLRLVLAGKDQGIEVENGDKLTFDEYAARFLPDSIRQRIDYLGPISPDKVMALRRRAGVYVSSSRFECCAYAVMETLAMGCPVLATATYGAAEFLKDGEEIMIAPVADEEALADKLNEMVADPARAEEIGAAGREAAVRCFSPERIAAESLGAYERAIALAKG